MTTFVSPTLLQGVVYNKSNGLFTVHAGEAPLACTLAGSLRAGRHGAAPDVLAVGDHVRVLPGPNGTGTIVEVLPRRNTLARRAAASRPGAYTGGQVIAANIDQVVAVMAAASPAPKWNLLDRYLVQAESQELPALVCLTKIDLLDPAEAGEQDAALDEFRRLGYGVLTTSAATGGGLEALSAALAGKVSVLVGKSGVGKTSLLNALEPGLGQRVSEVSRATGKGRHTTTQAQLFPLAGGGALVDTPGSREFGLWDLEADDLALFFPEMRPWVGQCRFGLDCRHDEEPGCAIRQAVMREEISPRRYQSYLRLYAEV